MSFRSADLLRLINEHGKNLTYTSKSAATYNPATGGATGTNTTKTVKGYFYSYSASDITGSSIVLGDRRLVIPTVDTSGAALPAPKKGDTFAGEGDIVAVVSVERIMSGANPVCYICQTRE
jgi:hypothetical protein